MLKLYLKYQLRKQSYVYSLLIFSVGILLSFSSEKMPILSVLIPSFFYKKFIYPLNDSEIDNRLIRLSAIDTKQIIRLQNISLSIWFFSGYFLSYLFYLLIKPENIVSFFDLAVVIPVGIFSFLIGNIYCIHFSKALTYNVIFAWLLRALYLFLIVTFFLLLILLKYFEIELYIAPITTLLFLFWALQTKQTKQ